MTLGLYSFRQEENIYIRRQAGTWRRSGLITDDQLRAIHDDTDPQVHQTNLFFRLLFFVFTLLCAGAVTGLFVWLIDHKGHILLSVILIVSGVVYYLAAEYLVHTRRLYRYGIEEALSSDRDGIFLLGMRWAFSMKLADSNKEIINRCIRPVCSCRVLDLSALRLFIRGLNQHLRPRRHSVSVIRVTRHSEIDVIVCLVCNIYFQPDLR